MALNPYRLRLLASLHRLGTVRAVAEQARMSPSNVSQQLAVLEAETRTVLLERSARRVHLTAAGVLLATRATTILDDMDAAEAELTALTSTPSGPVRLGAFSSALQGFVITAARRLRKEFPLIELELVEAEPGVSLPALQRGELDLAVSAGFVDAPAGLDPTVQLVPLLSDELVLVLPREHPVASSGGSVELRRLRDERWSVEEPQTYLSRLVTEQCRRAGFEPRVAGRFTSYAGLLAHVEAGLSVTVLPRLAVDAQHRVVVRPLPDAPERQISAAFRRSTSARVSVQQTLAALVRAAGGQGR